MRCCIPLPVKLNVCKLNPFVGRDKGERQEVGSTKAEVCRIEMVVPTFNSLLLSQELWSNLFVIFPSETIRAFS